MFKVHHRTFQNLFRNLIKFLLHNFINISPRTLDSEIFQKSLWILLTQMLYSGLWFKTLSCSEFTKIYHKLFMKRNRFQNTLELHCSEIKTHVEVQKVLRWNVSNSYFFIIDYLVPLKPATFTHICKSKHHVINDSFHSYVKSWLLYSQSGQLSPIFGN